MQVPVPVIARIPGWCLGGGLEVALACDLRLCDDSAMFGMPEVKVGIPSVIHAALLPRLLGESRAGWLLQTGETIDAAMAGLPDDLRSAIMLPARFVAVPAEPSARLLAVPSTDRRRLVALSMYRRVRHSPRQASLQAAGPSPEKWRRGRSARATARRESRQVVQRRQ